MHPGTPSACRTGTGASSTTSDSASHVTTNPVTPSKMGNSPRPSILRKRDFDGAPLKANKNLSATLAMMTSTTSISNNCSSAAVSTTATISPQSPRRLELGAIPPAGHGDSSRSSSGGSTTLSASSSPGIPVEIDENNSALNTCTASTSVCLDKTLSHIRIKQEDSSELNMNSLRTIGLPSVHSQGFVSTAFEMSPRKKPRKQQL